MTECPWELRNGCLDMVTINLTPFFFMTEMLQSGANRSGKLSSWRILTSFPGSWSLFGTGNKIAEVEIYKIIDNSYFWVRRQWKSWGGPGSVLLNRARPFVSSHLNYVQAPLWVTRASGEDRSNTAGSRKRHQKSNFLVWRLRRSTPRSRLRHSRLCSNVRLLADWL